MRAVELLLLAALASALTINTNNVTMSPSVEGYMGPVELGGGLFVSYKVRPADFCVVVNASNVAIVNFFVRCSAGVLIANSHNVTIAKGGSQGESSASGVSQRRRDICLQLQQRLNKRRGD